MIHSLVACLSALFLIVSPSQPPTGPHAEVARLEFHSSFWLNLHHTLYAATAKSVREVSGDVIPRLERFYGVQWFEEPVRIDVVWVANRQGAYTTTEPVHAVISSGAPDHQGWTSAELVFHEVSHKLVYPLEKELATALGPALKQHRDLWHVVQFHLTGAAVQQALRTRKIEYTPILNQGLLDRAWPQYRAMVEQVWVPYTEGELTREEAIARSVPAVR